MVWNTRLCMARWGQPPPPGCAPYWIPMKINPVLAKPRTPSLMGWPVWSHAPPVQPTQAGPRPQGGPWEGAQLCPARVSGGSWFAGSLLQSSRSCSDPTRRRAPVPKDGVTASPSQHRVLRSRASECRGCRRSWEK